MDVIAFDRFVLSGISVDSVCRQSKLQALQLTTMLKVNKGSGRYLIIIFDDSFDKFDGSLPL